MFARMDISKGTFKWAKKLKNGDVFTRLNLSTFLKYFKRILNKTLRITPRKVKDDNF